jgi:uncharacterized protein YrrD
VIINPTTQQVTHWVVREKGLHHTERLVPVDQVMQTTCDVINLRCTRDELATMKPFIVTQYVQVEALRNKAYPSAYADRADWEWVPVKHECTPPGRVAVRRGTKVQAVDGRVGRVEEFLMDPTSGRITHLVMREGHSWAPKDVTIPISDIGSIGERAVYLTLDRHSVESLPAVPVKWH